MVKKKYFYIYIIIINCFVLNKSYAQQDPQFSQNMFNMMSVNPGFAGSNNSICITGIHREQWMGFTEKVGEGENKEKVRVSPRTSNFSISAPLSFLHGGLSANIMQDNIGFEQNTGLDIGYAYQEFVGYGKLGIGFQVGFLNKTINFKNFEAIQEDDPLLQGEGDQNAMFMDFALGTYYKADNMYWGVSSTQLIQSKAELGSASPRLKRHFYFTGGYTINLPDAPKFDITPSFFIKTDVAATQYDLNTLLKYNDKVWGGLSYRFTDAIVVMGGLKWEKYKFGFAYDIPTSAISHAGSLEIMVNYCFKIETEKLPESYRNVRFL